MYRIALNNEKKGPRHNIYVKKRDGRSNWRVTTIVCIETLTNLQYDYIPKWRFSKCSTVQPHVPEDTIGWPKLGINNNNIK